MFCIPRYLLFSNKILQSTSGTFHICKKFYCTNAHQVKPIMYYDLMHYEFPFSSEETNIILRVLNTSSQEELSEFRIGKIRAKKLAECRGRVGCFCRLSDLLNIDGFGLKSVERLCETILLDRLSDSEKENDFLLKAKFNKKRLVKPQVCPGLIQDMETFMAFDIMIRTLSWTLMNRHGTILDLGTEELIGKSERPDSHKMYEKMILVSENIPRADVYLWEEKTSYAFLQKAPVNLLSIAIKLAQMRGMLIGLLKAKEDEVHHYYMRDVLVSKLFNLKVGGERISGSDLADKLMKNEDVLHWLPPLMLNENVEQKYFSLDIVPRKHISIPLFLNLAFWQTFITENNLHVQEILMSK